VAIQPPIFKQKDWIAALPAVARNDEGGGEILFTRYNRR